VPLCRGNYRQLHQVGNEVAWWNEVEIDALEIAKTLWTESRAKKNPARGLRGVPDAVDQNKSVSSGKAAPIKDQV
jgi:hypothetical protein